MFLVFIPQIKGFGDIGVIVLGGLDMGRVPRGKPFVLFPGSNHIDF